MDFLFLWLFLTTSTSNSYILSGHDISRVTKQMISNMVFVKHDVKKNEFYWLLNLAATAKFVAHLVTDRSFSFQQWHFFLLCNQEWWPVCLLARMQMRQNHFYMHIFASRVSTQIWHLAILLVAQVCLNIAGLCAKPREAWGRSLLLCLTALPNLHMLQLCYEQYKSAFCWQWFTAVSRAINEWVNEWT